MNSCLIKLHCIDGLLLNCTFSHSLFDQLNGKNLDFGGMQVDDCTKGSKGDRRIDRTKGGKNHPRARGQWKVIFLGFSRSGWTSGAQAYQTQINQQPVAGANWASTGLRLLELIKWIRILPVGLIETVAWSEADLGHDSV